MSFLQHSPTSCDISGNGDVLKGTCLAVLFECDKSAVQSCEETRSAGGVYAETMNTEFDCLAGSTISLADVFCRRLVRHKLENLVREKNSFLRNGLKLILGRETGRNQAEPLCFERSAEDSDTTGIVRLVQNLTSVKEGGSRDSMEIPQSEH